MLEHLEVNNFAIIEHIEISLESGMTIFSGETGAGKSLIVDALGFLLGARSDNTIIREGAKECSVSGLFSIKQTAQALAWLEEKEIEWQPDEGLLLRRILKDNGRSIAWIGERQVSRNELSEFTQFLVDIHGQHEHQRLINPATHLSMLDAYAGLEQDLTVYRGQFSELRALQQEHKKILERKTKVSQETDYLEFVVKEISSIKPKLSEDLQLEAEEKRLSQHEKLFSAISEASELLNNMEASDVVHSIKRAKTNLETARSIDTRLATLSDQLSAAYYELEDISESIKQYQNNLKFDPVRLEAIQQRLAELQKLKRKYGPEISDVLEKYEHAKESLDRYAHTDEDIAEREKELKAKKMIVLESAIQISEKRIIASKKMSHSIEEIVRNLGMPEIHVNVNVVKLSDENGTYRIGPDGIDEVEFLIAPNLGEPERPLNKIASGGELSRFALALKAVLASRDEVETMVFDEIDAGIGGQVGVAVGNYLQQLSEFCQVLCVTHLATIAARARYQWKVDKRIEGGRTITQLSLLSREEREAEIARMLSGSSDSEASRVHAAELLDQASSFSR